MTQLLSQHHGRWQIGANENITWRTAESFTKGCALVLSVDSEPQSDWVEADLIGIEFPAFTDGRGLSLAVLLRQRGVQMRALTEFPEAAPHGEPDPREAEGRGGEHDGALAAEGVG